MKDEHKTKKLFLRELMELSSQNTELKKSLSGDISAELAVDDTHRYAESILETLRDPILVLDEELKIISANRSFYTTFKTNPEETIGSFIYDLKNRQWDIPKLRELLEEVIPEKQTFDDFEISHEFRDIGHKVMLLNAREIYRKEMGAKVLLLAFEDITEQKRLEDLLADSEERYRRLFETANDGIVLMEKDQGKITHANPAFEKMLGYNMQEVVDNKLQNFVVLPDLHDFQTIMQVLNKEGIIKFDDVLVTTKSRQHLVTEIYFVDRAKLVQCNIRDVTERKRQEEALRENEEKFRTIFNSSSDAIFIHDTSGRFLEVNDVACERLGYTRDELLEMTLMDIDTPEAARIAPEHIRHLHQEGFISFEGAHQRKDGQQFPVEITSRLIGYEGETWILSTVRDITERKQAEERLRTAHDKVDTLVQLSADGLIVLDQDGIILFLNPAAAEILGQEQDELLGKQFGHPLIPGSDTEIELLSNSREDRVVELLGRETEWNGQTALLVSLRDITKRKRAEEKIYYLAYYDELTDLPNRRLFYDRLKQIAARSEVSGNGGVVFLVDITRLREVNDTLGQQAGDELIRQVARRLAGTVGEEDTVARVSGGEFMVLAEGKDACERAQSLGVRILEHIGREFELSGRLIYPGVNIGFTLFPQRGTDPDTLIKQGDIALSEAKKSAHRIQEFAGQDDWISRQFHLEHDLKKALANEEFFLCYQTQIDLRTGRIVGLEALLRWAHPQRGIVSPGEFISVLEQTGMIAAVDEWVIHRVCKQLGSWQKRGIFMKTAVNLSARELCSDAIIEVVRTALSENKLQAGNLGVEITETDLMENVEQTSRILQTLSSWGVRVALDDFGTGYSSLSYLQKLPINIIKIDKEFVDGLPENKDSVTLVQTIIAMAHNLGKEVLAEGVEREEQRQKLIDLGCDYGQGFLWSRPQPVENLTLIGS